MGKSYWYYLVSFWTFVCLGAIVLDFLYRGQFSRWLPTLLVVYISVLTLYAGIKEFERWYDVYDGRHPGEVFVFLWTVVVAGVVIANLVLKRDYKLPEEVISTYIAVLGIMAITQKSKRLYKKRHKK